MTVLGLPIMKTYPVQSISRTSLLIMLILSGCATDDPDRQVKQGAAIGALTGAVIGHQIDGDKGRFLGAAQTTRHQDAR